MATDDFNRANSGSIGSNWSHIDNGLTIVSNTATGATLSVSHREIWATSVGTEQTVEAVVSSFPTGGSYCDARIVARHTNVGGSSFYELRYNNAGAYFLVRNVGGGETTLSNSSGAAISVPETFRLEVEGTGGTVTLRVYRGGVLQGTATDTSGSRLTSGDYGGIATYSDVASIAFDEFTISSPTGPPITTQSHYRWGLDDGSESGHTWDAAEDTPTTAAAAQRRLLRAQVDNNTAGDITTGHTLQYKRADEGAEQWRDL